jgi:hypothetical protein
MSASQSTCHARHPSAPVPLERHVRSRPLRNSPTTGYSGWRCALPLMLNVMWLGAHYE